MNVEVKRCKQCLIKEHTNLLYDFFAVGQEETSKDIKKVTLDEQGLCNYCNLYNKNYNQEYLNYEITNFISNNRNNSEYDCFVALSGGKDSIAALYLAVKNLDLKVIAFTYDNGFIPQNVLEQAERICKELNVPYIIKKKELYTEFKNEYTPNEKGEWLAKTGVDFCQICSKQIWVNLIELALEKGIYKVITGNKIYAKLEPYVSCTKNLKVYQDNKKINITEMNLLFALQVTLTQQKIILERVKWIDPKLKGYTSNCLVPGFTEYARSKKIKTDSDAGYIERELRSNCYTPEEVQELLFEKEYKDSSKEIDAFFGT